MGIESYSAEEENNEIIPGAPDRAKVQIAPGTHSLLGDDVQRGIQRIMAHLKQLYEGTAGAPWLRQDQNLADLEDVVEAKANLGLATVATTGSYNDLLNKPTLGTAAAEDISAFATIESLGGSLPGTAGIATFQSFGTNEAREAAGLQQKRITLSEDGKNYVLDSEDIAPAFHYVVLGADGTARLDVSVMRNYEPYIVVNGSTTVARVLELDCGELNYFKARGIPLADAITRVLKVRGGERVVLTKVAGGIIQVDGKRESEWTIGSNYRYRYLPDDTIEAFYTRTDSISGSTESTANFFPAGIDVSAAKVVSVKQQPNADGSTTGLHYPQVTKLGTTHGLSANQFAIMNVGTVATQSDIVVHFIDITEA